MKNTPDVEAAHRLQELILRETGAPLPTSAEPEIKAIVRAAMGTCDVAPYTEINRREVTILLADLRGFTALSSSQPAERIISMLNTCLARMNTIILGSQGTIDKFMGDAIMVLFGAPIALRPDGRRPRIPWSADRGAAPLAGCGEGQTGCYRPGSGAERSEPDARKSGG